MYYLALEEIPFVVNVKERVCLLAIDFVGVKPKPEVDSGDLRSVHPVEVVVVNFVLDDLNSVLELQLTAQTEFVLCRSHNIHIAVFIVVRGSEVASDHRRINHCLVNQLRVVRPRCEINVTLGSHLKGEALPNKLPPAL